MSFLNTYSFEIVQLIVGLYAFCMGKFQVSIIKGMITYWPPYGSNPYNKPFHRFAWIMAAIVGLLGFCITGDWQTLLLSALIYSLVFDGVINKEVFKNFYYIGYTAFVDRTLRKWFGKNAGKWKFWLCLITIVAVNFLKHSIWIG